MLGQLKVCIMLDFTTCFDNMIILLLIEFILNLLLVLNFRLSNENVLTFNGFYL